MASFEVTASDSAVSSEASARTVSFARSAVRWATFPSSTTFPSNSFFPGETLPESSTTVDSNSAHKVYTRAVGEIAKQVDVGIATTPRVRSAGDSSTNADVAASRSIFHFNVTGSDNAIANTSLSRLVKGSRSVADIIVSRDTIGRRDNLVRAIVDQSVAVDLNKLNIALHKTASDASVSADSSKPLSSRARRSQDVSELHDLSARGPSHLVKSATEASVLLDSNVRRLSLPVLISESAKASDSGLRIVNLFASMSDRALALDVGHVLNKLRTSAADTITIADSAKGIYTRPLFGTETALMVDTIVDTTTRSMGSIIWVEKNGEFVEVINNLQVYEGKIFPYPEGDVFSYQLTKYPISVNQPRLTTAQL